MAHDVESAQEAAAGTVPQRPLRMLPTTPASTRELEEEVAKIVSANYPEQYAVILLHPWSDSGHGGPPPTSVLAPALAGTEAELAEDAAVKEVTDGKRAVLIPCTFEAEDEEAAARRIMEQVWQVVGEGQVILMLQFMAPGVVPDRETNEVALLRHNLMLSTGPDNVVVNPVLEPVSLRTHIETACIVAELHSRRVQLTLESEPPWPDEALIRELEAQNRRLLWVDILRVLMRRMPRVDPSLQETALSVGPWRFVQRCPARSASVYHAQRPESEETVIVKVIEKEQVSSPGELEGIYREFILTSSTLQHPNITRCREVLHSEDRVYFLFDYAGPDNLMQVLIRSPANRISHTEVMEYFHQISSALAFCHGRRVAHRDVSLEHIVVAPASADAEGRQTPLVCRLIDFRSALVVEENTTSRTSVGQLPCMAPEIAIGEAYTPKMADLWSLGVVLLEMAGGLSTMERFVHWTDDLPLPTAARQAMERFGRPAAHAEALGLLGARRTPEIVEKLEALLQPEVHRRTQLSGLLAPAGGAAAGGPAPAEPQP